MDRVVCLAMFDWVRQLVYTLRLRFQSRARLEAENLVLRQQLNIAIRKLPNRLQLMISDRLMLMWLYRIFPSLLNAIRVVRPETIIRWHRNGFRAYWRWKSRPSAGRPTIDGELRDLIRQMSMANPLWGAPRTHGELLMLGIEIAQSKSQNTWCQGLADHRLRAGRPSSAITQPASFR